MTDNNQLEAVKKDFRLFLFVVWKFLNLPDPTPVQYDIADYLQHGPKRLTIQAFRGVGKSWVTSAFVVWVLLNDPQKKILVVSASKERSDAFSSFTKRLINELPILQHLIANSKQRDSMVSFDVGPALADHSPSVKSVGISGQITGSRADLIIADDIEVLNNSLTQTMRDKLSETVKEFDAVLKPLDTSRIIYLGTPQTEMSIYNLLPERGYQTRIWPAEYPDKKARVSYGERLAPFIAKKVNADESLVGHTTDPQRFSDEDLLERKLSYGKAGFALQFMLDTSLSDADRYPLKLQDLCVTRLDPRTAPLEMSWGPSQNLLYSDLPAYGFTGDRYYEPFHKSSDVAPYTGVAMSIDPAGRGKDETGYAVIKFLNGYLYLVEAGGLIGGYNEENLKYLANVAKKHGVNYVITESNFGDGMFTQLLRPIMKSIHPCVIEEVRHHSQKERRIIDTIEPVMARHQLVVDPRVIEEDAASASKRAAQCGSEVQYSLFYQMTRVTQDKGALVNDDRLDALAMCVAYWVDRMDQDNEVQAAAHRQALLDKELDSFMESATGRSPKASKWMGLGIR